MYNEPHKRENGGSIVNALKYDEGEKERQVRIYPNKWTAMGLTGAHALANDGEPEKERQEIAQIGGFVTAFHNEPAMRDTRAKLTVDREYLYIEMKSDEKQREQEQDKGRHEAQEHISEAETVFVLLSTHADKHTFYSIAVVVTGGPHPFSIGYNNWTGAEQKDKRQTFIGLGEKDGVRTVVAKGAGGSWVAKVAVPLAALNGPDVQAGSEWRLNIIRYFGPESPVPLSSWIPIRTGTVRMDDIRHSLAERVFRLDLFVANEGRLGPVFVGKPPGVCMSSSATLLYQSFTEKTIQFRCTGESGALDLKRLQMSWIDPQGRLTAISPTKADIQGDMVEMRFVHPEPSEEGMYQIRLAAEGYRDGESGFALFVFDRFDLIAAGERAAGLEANVSAISKRQIDPAPPSEQVLFLEKLIPDNVGFFAAGVPHRPLLGFRSTNYTWSPESPWIISSVDEDHLSYPNDRYSESNMLTVYNKKGKPVQYPYYEDEQGRRYFLTAHLWHFQRRYAIAETGKLAAADPLGVARLLLRFVEAYEGWVRFNDSVWVQHPIPGDAPPPYSYFGGMWDRWSLMDLYRMLPLIDAFQEVDRTNAFELLSEEVGEDVRTRIVDGMLHPSLESVLTYPILQHNVEYGNWLGLIKLGKALGEPRYIHEAVERMVRFVQSSYLADGFWKEITLSYHRQTYEGLIQTIRCLEGWTDPAGYICSRDGVRYDQLEPGRDVPQIARMLRLPDLLAYPNGSCFPVNDTWAFQKAANPQSTESFLLPWAGIAKLTRGHGAEQAQLYLSFSPNNGHDHKDPLNIALFANGLELLPDLGYTHTFYRQWSVSTLGHNTVTVNGRDAQISGNAKQGGNVELFALEGDVQIVRARQEAAYEELKEYSRELWFVGFQGAAAAEGYIVDLFRVSGGMRHEYTLNGEANQDSGIAADVGMIDYGPYLIEGRPDIIEPKQETDYGGTSDDQYYAYTYVKEVKQAELPDGVYEMTMTSNGDAEASAQASLHVFGHVGKGNNRLFLGRAPSFRATRLNGLDGDRNSEAVKYDMPKWIVRRECPKGTELYSQFVHVLEPCAAEGKRYVERVEVLLSEEMSKRAVVAITYGNVTDILMSDPHYDGGEPLRAGEWELAGKNGFIRMENGQIRTVTLAGGTRLSAGGRTIVGSGPVAGTILDVIGPERAGGNHGLIVDGDIPQSVVGRYVIVTHPDRTTSAYPIVSISRQTPAGATILQLTDDPGFLYTALADGAATDRPSRMTAHPGTEWRGSHTFHIDNVVTASFPRE